MEAWQTGELQLHLARFGRRLRLRYGWLLAQRSLWVACMAAVLIQLAGRIRPVDRLWLWTLTPLAVWLLAVVGLSLLRPLPPIRVARRVDAELGLKERLATALTLGGWKAERLEGNARPFSHPTFQLTLVALQHHDALAVACAIRPHQSFPLHWLRRPLLLAAILVAVTVPLAMLPNPMDAVLVERAAVAQAAEEQAEQIEKLREEIEKAQELTPEERKELLRQLAELAEQLRANPGDREEALADFSKIEEALRQKLDPNADARQAALEALAAQMQALAGTESGKKADLSDAAEALEKLAEKLAEMDAAEQEALAQSLAQMAARAAQAGDSTLAQALATLAQAAQPGDSDAASLAAQAAVDALAQARSELADQVALRQALSQLQESRQAVAQAGQGQGQGQVAAQGQGEGQGQGQGQGGMPGSGGGTQADTLPPANRTGEAGRPQGDGRPGATGELDQQVYVPWERRQGSGDQVTITGQDTGQGETQVREQKEPLPGAPGEPLVPYHEVYYDYLDAVHQAMERSYIPSGLKDYVREYFSQLEP
jgi:hypothetical protein